MVVAGALLASACRGSERAAPPTSGTAPATTVPRVLFRSDTYGDPANWVCRPDTADVCDGDLDTTVIAADGTTTVERWAPAADPPVDCFYVYPTVSTDQAPVSDLVPGVEQELRAARVQAARFGTSCRVFAPMYHQATVSALSERITAQADPFAAGTGDAGYADVAEAFHHYLDNDSGDRGFVLLGHSQGSTLLTRLLDREILTDPALKARLVSAVLLGMPPGEHPDPLQVPGCRSDADAGCLVAYSSFMATAPPGAASYFARWADPAACTNPAAPAGGRATLHPYLSATTADWLPGTAVTTPFVAPAGLFRGECLTSGPFRYLAVSAIRDAGDRRPAEVPTVLGPSWGLHLNDVQMAQGDLVDLVGRQGRSWRNRR